MNLKKLKKRILKSPNILKLLSFLYSANNFYRLRYKRGTKISYSGCFLSKTWIIVKKKKNIVTILTGSILNNCSIYVYGENNTVIIGENCRLVDVELHIEDNNNSILIGNNTTIAGKTHLACIEGTKIVIGEDCMFSKDIVFRTGDSHSIIDDLGLRINPSKDIYIGNHVWVGNKVIVTKGSSIGSNSVIATGSIVTKAFLESNAIFAGSPAKIMKEKIDWVRKRV